MNTKSKVAEYPRNFIIDVCGRDLVHPNTYINVFTYILKMRYPDTWEKYLTAISYYYDDGLSLTKTGLEMNLSYERVRQMLRISNHLMKTVIEGRSPKNTNKLCFSHISVRVANVLTRYGVESASDILNIPPDKMLNIPNIGKNSIAEIMRAAGDEYLKKYWPEFAGKLNIAIFDNNTIYQIFKNYEKYKECCKNV